MLDLQNLAKMHPPMCPPSPFPVLTQDSPTTPRSAPWGDGTWTVRQPRIILTKFYINGKPAASMVPPGSVHLGLGEHPLQHSIALLLQLGLPDSPWLLLSSGHCPSLPFWQDSASTNVFFQSTGRILSFQIAVWVRCPANKQAVSKQSRLLFISFCQDGYSSIPPANAILWSEMKNVFSCFVRFLKVESRPSLP